MIFKFLREKSSTDSIHFLLLSLTYRLGNNKLKNILLKIKKLLRTFKQVSYKKWVYTKYASHSIDII